MKTLKETILERLKLSKDNNFFSDLLNKFLNLDKNDKVYLYSLTNWNYEILTLAKAPKLFDWVYKYYNVYGSNDVFMKGYDSFICLKEILDNNEKYIIVNTFNSQTNQFGGTLILFFNEYDAKEFRKKSKEEQLNLFKETGKKYINNYLTINDYLNRLK